MKKWVKSGFEWGKIEKEFFTADSRTKKEEKIKVFSLFLLRVKEKEGLRDH